jgi:hypothetical protein
MHLPMSPEVHFPLPAYATLLAILSEIILDFEVSGILQLVHGYVMHITL